LVEQRDITRNGISVTKVDSEKAGSNTAKELLYEITDAGTLLFLSGGNTPAVLYSMMAAERRLAIGAAAMVDERYGKPMHENSNELMIKKSGLMDYFKRQKIPFYRILDKDQNLANSAFRYNETVGSLFSRYPKSVAILGVGEDGHLAGIAPNRPDFSNPLFSADCSSQLVSFFEDPYVFGQRVTMTTKGLSMLNILIVLVFGEKKKDALSRLFKRGPVAKVPSRFLKRPKIAHKTLLITDQDICDGFYERS
jgi:6-phosphogluconolactonase/glucosamine-6-phosphate isomerase/deaminase